VCVLLYLTGAPLLWAGLSSTVTVLSVWFREVSWSYAGMEGAKGEKEAERGLTTLQSNIKTSSANIKIIHITLDIKGNTFSQTWNCMFASTTWFPKNYYLKTWHILSMVCSALGEQRKKWRHKKTIYSRWTVSENDVLNKGGNSAKNWHRTWEMDLALQLIHLLFTEASSKIASVEGWLSGSHS